jgi:cytolysin (calcineurin-like family phosphatase)
MKLKLDENWTTTNNKAPFDDDEVARYNSVLPQARQVLHAQKPFYLFMHFGMNTATGREWGNATETVDDLILLKSNHRNGLRRLRSAEQAVLF